MARHKMIQRLLNSAYEVYDDPDDENLIGEALVEEGVIQKLYVKDNLEETFHGQVLSILMRNIIGEADYIGSNLSMRVSANTMRLRRFLERHGFHEADPGIYKRIAGSIRPPAVPY